MNYKRLGDYIRTVNNRNRPIVTEDLRGLSMKKEFRKSTSNIVGVDLSKYKLISKNQFACDFMSVIRVHKLPVVLHTEDKPVIVSPAYTVFEVLDEEILNPEYLMMWFRRSEFDRYADFRCDSAVRGGFMWEELCDTQLPIPSIEKQRQIVAEYNTVTNRINLNEQLNQKLEETAQALYKHWFVDFEFPVNLARDPNPSLRGTKQSAHQNLEPHPIDSVRHPELDSGSHQIGYKSSGGKMVYNEELDKEIPFRWSEGKLGDFSKIKGGKRMPAGTSLIKDKTKHTYIKVADLGKSKYVQYNKKFEFVPTDVAPKISRYITHKNDVIISIVGTIGVVKILGDSLNGANLTENCMKITELNKFSPSYLYHYLVSKEGKEEIQIRNVGAVQAKLPMYNIESFPIIIPQENVMEKFDEIINDLDKKINNLVSQSQTLQELQSLLLAKMTQVETEKEIVN